MSKRVRTGEDSGHGYVEETDAVGRPLGWFETDPGTRRSVRAVRRRPVRRSDNGCPQRNGSAEATSF